MHHHVENIILSCLECKNAPLIEHLLHECNLVGKILEAEKNFTLKDSNKVIAHSSLSYYHLIIGLFLSMLFVFLCIFTFIFPIMYLLLLCCILWIPWSELVYSILPQPTVPAEGRSPPRIGNIGHLTRISNKLIQLGNNNSEIHAYLQVITESWVFFLLVTVSGKIAYSWNAFLLVGCQSQELVLPLCSALLFKLA